MGVIIRLIPYREPEPQPPKPTPEEELRREETRARFVGSVNRVRAQLKVVQAFRRPVTRTRYDRE
eukprot:JZ550746.1.p2 GENE.JZ550746.1~~JZ550746.1.p2  ORF type:complete len:65 (+),score=18.57 JZ550746.1:136-330(+)